MPKSKYRNIKDYRILNGTKVVFDSRKEARRYDALLFELKHGKISEFTIQPYYLLCDTIKHEGKTYPKVSYSPDFRYIRNGKTIVEDVKSDATAKDKTYRVKVKWFLHLYGKDIIFKEI